ncbi:MAG: hypothetical protein RMJ98_16645 [Myxococcales bacterium]|nr:hypothetical protein [Polyangiaceae bacterium]MDW8250925.1 hypothetical protein [Myxococcales bacterium]
MPVTKTIVPFSTLLRHTPSTLLASLVAASLSSCSSNEVAIKLSDPNGLREFAVWAEFNVFEGGCPSEEDLAAGIFPPPLKSQVVAVDEPLPAIGTLPAKEYGFSILLRQEDCAIVGFGCVKANLEKVRSINIRVNPTYLDEEGNLLPEGACVTPATCQQGRCTEENGEGGSGGSGGAPPVLQDFECKKTPAGPTSCALEVMGYGAFPAPAPGNKVGNPSVIQTTNGFSVAYHEISADGSKRVVRVIPVGNDGCNGAMGEATFDECPGISFTNFESSLGGAWNPTLNSGILGFSRRPCPEKNKGAGVGLVSIDSTGKLKEYATIDSNDPSFSSLKFAQQYSMSAGLNTEEFRLIYVQNGFTQSFPTLGVGTNATGVDNFFSQAPDAPILSAEFAIQARAGNLAVQATSGNLNGTKTAMLRITKGDVKYVPRPPALEMGMLLLGNQILVASRSPINEIGWALLSDDGTQLSPTGSDQSNLLEATSGGFALGSTGDRAIFAVGRQGGFRISAFSNLSSGSPAPIPVKEFTKSEIPPLDAFDGKQIAAAAASGRFVVAWTHNNGGSSAGGVAIIKCE